MQTVDINSELYQPILAALNVDVDDHGQLMMKYPERTVAATVGKRNLLLPSNEVLRSLPENALVFHPMSENVARGDSSIQNYLKMLVTFKVTFAITYIAQQLYTVAADHKQHSKLTGEQLAILTILPEADAKGLANLNRVLESIEMTKVRLYNVFNKRNGEIAGNRFNRVAVASFPLLMEMLDSADTLWGHRDVRKRDLKDFKALFDYICPDWSVKDHYSAASDSMEAPSFHALMSAFVKIMEPINRVASIYGGLFKDKSEEGEIVDMKPYVSADLNFQHRLSNLSKYRNLIPVMAGNDGEALAGTVETQEVVQNPRSVAPAFAKQNLGDDIKVPSAAPVQQQQVIAPVQNQQQQQTVYTNQQQQNYGGQQQQMQTNTSSPGVAGFGNYNQNEAQNRGYNNGFGVVNQGGYVNQQQQNNYQSNGSGVAGFGSYSSNNAGFGGQQQGGFVNGFGVVNQGGFPQQQTQVNPPSVFDSWNSAAQQQQQTAFVQQQSNPYTTPSAPQTQYGAYAPQGGYQQQQIQLPPGCQLAVLPNGQQIVVNQYGQQVQVMPQQQQQQQQNGFVPQTGGYPNQGGFVNQGVQQNQFGFKVRK